MPLDPQQIMSLTDLHGRNLGRVSLQRIEGHQVVGVFTPGDDFAAVRDVFAEFEVAVNEQMFSEADRLSREIDRLGLTLSCPDTQDRLSVRDVQIMGMSGFCCQIPNLALTQMPRAVA
jgi:hypothetical protein